MFARHGDQFTASGDDRLAGVLGAFSYALDLTEGQTPGHSLRCAWLGAHVAAAIGLDGAALDDVFYACVLKDLGCSVNAAKVSQLFVGDDRALKADFKLIGPAPEDFGAFILREVGAGAPADVRDAAIAALMDNIGPIMTDIMDSRCTRGADIARKLRFSEDVAGAIAHLDEHWDGSGLPGGVAGTNIHLGGRIALLTQVADVFFIAGGPDAARAEIAARSGGWLDPALCAAFDHVASHAELWDPMRAPDFEAQLLALPPAQRSVAVDDDYLDDIVAAFGLVIDAKSPFTGGHSGRVAQFADLIGAHLGMDAAARRPLRHAAMLHDVGKLGVSSAILEKPGKLDADEWAAVQTHASHTAAILGRVPAMRDYAMIAAAHHERLDGKGYPLGLDAACLARESRIITVADYFDALTADRPYRAAMPVDQALAMMARDVGTAIDSDCFAALQAVVADGIPAAPLPSLPGVSALTG